MTIALPAALTEKIETLDMVLSLPKSLAPLLVADVFVPENGFKWPVAWQRHQKPAW